MKNILMSFWFWGLVLAVFVALILYEEDLTQKATSEYVRYKMGMEKVNWSQIEAGFEHARMYANTVSMENNKSHMKAQSVETIFFRESEPDWNGKLTSLEGLKNPMEAKFWGDVRAWNTDNERLKTEELRYFFNRKELRTDQPITIWKDGTVTTGVGLTYNTETKNAEILSNVKIRIWEEKKSTHQLENEDEKKAELAKSTGLPIAPPIEDLLKFSPIIVDENSSEIVSDDSKTTAIEEPNEDTEL